MFARRTQRRAPMADPRNWTWEAPQEAIPQMQDDLVEHFKADVMREVLAYRGQGYLDGFAAAIDREVERYRRKSLDAATMNAIKAVADRAIDRARKFGITAFEGAN